MELEESRNNLLQENQQLTESITKLQSQIQDLERSVASAHSSSVTTMHALETEDLNTQIETAHAVVGKLITENAELVEKVNELYAELAGHGVTAHSSSIPSDLTVRTDVAATDPFYGTDDNTAASVERIENERNGGGGGYVESKDVANPALNSSVPINVDNRVVYSKDINTNAESEEIVQIPLDEDEDTPAYANSEEIVQIPLNEDEDNQDLELQEASKNGNEKAGVPLSDAPLIGAPFRFISFVAKYVAGSDLVNKNAQDYGK